MWRLGARGGFPLSAEPSSNSGGAAAAGGGHHDGNRLQRHALPLDPPVCGIVGGAFAAPSHNREWLSRATQRLAHRGPDDSGQWWSADGRVGLGHRRLSVLDLSAAGHQPMARGSLQVVFNGEIYNYRDLAQELAATGAEFTSGSDTEVLLAAYQAWGVDCLARLDGMFSFVLYDPERRWLFAARDRAGEKPLFYHHSDEGLVFASELKALLCHPAVPRRIDPDALDCYLSWGYVPGAGCILRGVRKLAPAHAFTYSLHGGGCRLWPYWQLPPLQPGQFNPAEKLERLESLLLAAVGRQLVADVPVGVFLSGGVDSSLVTAAAARLRGGVRTFTVVFPGGGRHDESEHARQVAHHFGTHHTELAGSQFTPEVIAELAVQFDEPLADSSMIPTYALSRLTRQHCTVALGGDGADELFGGYHSFTRLLSLWPRLTSLPLWLRRVVAELAHRVGWQGPGSSWLAALDTPTGGLPQFSQLFSLRARRRLCGQPAGSRHSPAGAAWQALVPAGANLLDQAARHAFLTYLPGDILVKVDRASMLSSLEVRAPFLDRSLVEFAFGSVPSDLKAAGPRRKILLQALAQRWLPAGFDTARKQGFSLPLASWLQGGPWRNFFQQVLLQPDPGSPFQPAAVERLLNAPLVNHAAAERLFALVLFQCWRRCYGVSW